MQDYDPPSPQLQKHSSTPSQPSDSTTATVFLTASSPLSPKNYNMTRTQLRGFSPTLTPQNTLQPSFNTVTGSQYNLSHQPSKYIQYVGFESRPVDFWDQPLLQL